jgi:moderate conductance mechanosensitive channel
VPLAQVDTSQVQTWFASNLPAILVVGLVLILIYAYQNRIVGAVVGRFVGAQAKLVEDGSADPEELRKRSATLESLVRTILRVSVVSIVLLLVVGLLGLWSIIAGLGLFLAALTIAGQPIVLDYLTGILVIVEGQFFNGDSIATGTVSGTVEQVGLRRTVVRDPSGTVHSISNGELRIVSNRTRVFAAAEVTVRGIRENDLDRVAELMDRIGQEVATDPEFDDAVIEAPALAFIDDPDDLGMTAIMRGKVRASERWRVAGEIRRRLNRAFVIEGIELNKRGITPPFRREPGAAMIAADTDGSLDS